VTSLVLVATSGLPFDLALDAPRFSLWRHGSTVGLSLDEPDAARITRALAFNGVRASRATADMPQPEAGIRAVGITLAPTRLAPRDLDVIEVRVVPLAEATARALARPFRGWPTGVRRRARCRSLLRGEDALLEVRRTAWCDRATLRRDRGALRPALFDAGAAARPIRIYASESALTRWIEG
jgi:hypothetical protein